MSSPFILISPNGTKLHICKSVFNKKQKSFDVMFNNGKDNNWYKIGTIKDLETFEKFMENNNVENR